jgi:geranylgeranylglycerol-phosphate geranylgeranyltransferase
VRSRVNAEALLNPFAGLLSLTRPVNAFIAFAGIVCGGVIAGARLGDWRALLAAGAAGALLASFGNILNDYFDVDIDRINKPTRAIPAGIVSRSGALLWSIACAAAGMYISARLSHAHIAVAASCLLLMILYDAYLKRVPLLGNLVVGILTGVAFVFGALVTGDARAGLVPGAFACVYTFARELLKDVEDMEGDLRAEVRTFPLLRGAPASLRLVSAILLALIPLSLLPFLLGLYSVWYAATIVCCVYPVIVRLLIRLRNSPAIEELSALSSFMKYGMLAGMLAFLAGVLT